MYNVGVFQIINFAYRKNIARHNTNCRYCPERFKSLSDLMTKGHIAKHAENGFGCGLNCSTYFRKIDLKEMVAHCWSMHNKDIKEDVAKLKDIDFIKK